MQFNVTTSIYIINLTNIITLELYEDHRSEGVST